jgi:hypothetical protein
LSPSSEKGADPVITGRSNKTAAGVYWMPAFAGMTRQLNVA